MNNLKAIILAAGFGTRVGQSKWQLMYKGINFLEIIIQKILAAKISDIICVVNARSIPQNKNCDFVINPNPEDGMLSSIYHGIQHDSHYKNTAAGYLIFPVDHPLVASSTIVEMKKQFFNIVKKNGGKQKEFIVTPMTHNTSGHPIIISSTLAKSIAQHDFSLGLKNFLASRKIIIHKITVEDMGILQNINTLSDIESMINIL